MNTEIIVITDRSGSMGKIKADAEGGFTSFIEEQKLVPGDARVTLIMFDDVVETVYAAKPLFEVPPMVLMPRRMTALLDAIGSTLDIQGKRIADEKWAQLVIAVIITDGGENASKDYTHARIREMIEHAQRHGWKFVFLAANQDAFAVGGSLGISATFTSNFAANSEGTQAAYGVASSAVRGLRSL